MFLAFSLEPDKMGQTMGRMPETWTGLLEERDRVLHWSSEVLARVQDNVTNEDTFLMDYDDAKVSAKIDTWIKTNQIRVDEMLKKFPDASAQLKDTVTNGVRKVVLPNCIYIALYIYFFIYCPIEIKFLQRRTHSKYTDILNYDI